MRFKAAAVQLAAQPGDREANLRRALELVRQAARDGAKLVVLPELVATGYDPARAAGEAECIQGGGTAFALQEEARRKDLWIVASVAERPEQPGAKPWLSTFLVAPEGVSEPFRKIHLWGQEPQHFAPGVRTKVLPSRLGRLGPVGCYDLEFPEVARSAAQKGAQVLVASTAFFTAEVWDLATRARALENGCWLVAANYCAQGPLGKFCGRSRVVGPEGKVLADAGDKEGLAVAFVDPLAVLEERKRRPYLTDLRKVE